MVRKHSKNITAGSVFTAHERTEANSVHHRRLVIDSDSGRAFERCWLCLHVADPPVVTPLGVLYCKTCIVLNLGRQRVSALKQGVKSQKMAAIRMSVADESEIVAFKASEEGVLSAERLAIMGKGRQQHCQEMKNKGLLLPMGSTLTSSKTAVVKGHFYKKGMCPITGQPLKVKDLVVLNPDVKKSPEGAVFWECSISKRKILAQRVIAVRSSGQVIIREVAMDVLQGEGREDWIEMRQCGTSFSATTETKIKSKRG